MEFLNYENFDKTKYRNFIKNMYEICDKVCLYVSKENSLYDKYFNYIQDPDLLEYLLKIKGYAFEPVSDVKIFEFDYNVFKWFNEFYSFKQFIECNDYIEVLVFIKDKKIIFDLISHEKIAFLYN